MSSPKRRRLDETQPPPSSNDTHSFSLLPSDIFYEIILFSCPSTLRSIRLLSRYFDSLFWTHSTPNIPMLMMRSLVSMRRAVDLAQSSGQVVSVPVSEYLTRREEIPLAVHVAKRLADSSQKLSQLVEGDKLKTTIVIPKVEAWVSAEASFTPLQRESILSFVRDRVTIISRDLTRIDYRTEAIARLKISPLTTLVYSAYDEEGCTGHSTYSLEKLLVFKNPNKPPRRRQCDFFGTNEFSPSSINRKTLQEIRDVAIDCDEADLGFLSEGGVVLLLLKLLPWESGQNVVFFGSLGDLRGQLKWMEDTLARKRG